jgi:hypothetical protein
MNEYPSDQHRSDDVHLQALEARLASMVPRLESIEQQQLLYRCAFAAGQRAARGHVRRWQTAAIAMASVLGLVLILPFARNAGGAAGIADRDPAPPPREFASPERDATNESPREAWSTAVLELDAWQVERSEEASLAEELDRFREDDPDLQASSVAHLMRAFGQP